jgi:GntR family transcriptional regulator of vanillate catabolism
LLPFNTLSQFLAERASLFAQEGVEIAVGIGCLLRTFRALTDEPRSPEGPEMQRPQQQAVADKLREMILHGAFSGGDRLLEIPLSEQLEVSRTPVREALITLSDEGLVEYRPNRGYVVRSFALDDILNAYVVREALESLAARLLAERGIDRSVKRALEECLDEGDRILGVKRLTKAARDPWGAMNDRFHRLLVESTNNGALIDSLSRATNIPYASSRVVHWFEDDDIEGLYQLRFVHSQHHTIFKGICDGEGYRAEMTMRAHIGYTADHIRSKYFKDHITRVASSRLGEDSKQKVNGGSYTANESGPAKTSSIKVRTAGSNSRLKD